MDILVFGESLVDVFLDSRVVLGGAPFNTARAAARLNAHVEMVTTLSTDALGEQLLTALHSAGVHTTHVARSSLPTARVTVYGEPPTYTFSLDKTASVQFPRHSELPNKSMVSYGSVAALVEPFHTPLIAYLRQSNGIHFFDPNIRPDALPRNFPLAEHVASLASLADIIRLSDEDLAHLPEDTPSSWLAGRTQVIIITRGVQPGTILFQDGSEMHVSTVPSPVFIDSVGAGDTVNGSILASLQRLGEVPTTTAVWAALLSEAFAAAALTCGQRGANPPTRAQVAMFMNTLPLSELTPS